MSRLSEYLEKRLVGFPCALPEHLRGRLHNDWFGPLKSIPRSWNARGPRCGKGNPGYMAWPPRLEKGKGVARWESNGAASILEIPDLAKREVRGGDVYGKKWLAIERNPGHPDAGQTGSVNLEWHEMAWGEIGSGALAYSPSALQKFSPLGFISLAPDYWARWKMLEKREPAGEDKVLFARGGCRPDHVDLYYNVDTLLPIGMAGLHWE